LAGDGAAEPFRSPAFYAVTAFMSLMDISQIAYVRRTLAGWLSAVLGAAWPST